LSMLNPQLGKYIVQAVFHVLVMVGSPFSSLLFAFLLLSVLHGIGPLGAALQGVLSHRWWYPISTLSWWVYLVHPAIMSKYYVWHLLTRGEMNMSSVTGVFANAALQNILSFGFAILAYVVVEQPMELWLRRGEAAQAVIEAPAVVDGAKAPAPATSGSFYSRLKRVIFYYCCICMVWIVLNHTFWYAIITTQLEHKEFVDIKSKYTVPPRINATAV
jgi:hypothetical protein